MKNVNLYAYGRSTVQGIWNIDRSRIVNRLYYVNSGTALIHNASCEHRLFAGKIYIIPQCHSFHPISATDFDHTFFDFYSSRILRYDRIIEIDASCFSTDRFFDYINTLLENDTEKKSRSAMEQLLSGLLAVIECQYTSLPYVTNTVVTHAIDLIHRDCAVINTKILAQSLNLNESYFIRLFNSAMGMSPMKYIRACRVFHGKELLQSGASVAEAAEKCGYASPTAFYKAVKSEFHLTPSELKICTS